MRIVLKRSL